MRKKGLIIIGVILLLFVLQSCSSKPEDTILKRYFHADSLKDKTTMSNVAIEPISLDAVSWKVVSVSEEKIEPALLPELNKKELELKKKQEESIGMTLDAKEDLDIAEDELKNARTAEAKRAAKKKADEMKVKYEEIYANHLQLQKELNEAKAAAAREEEITNFSLQAGDISNIRDLTGQVHSKDVEIAVEGKTGARNYRVIMRKYDLKDEVLNLPRRGRWIILKIELIS